MQTKGWRRGKHRCRLRRWGDFGREVAALIRLLREVEGRFIIFSNWKSHRFVQFCVLGDGAIRGEAVSNNFLVEGERLTAADCRYLVELGWRKPGKTSRNFWSDWQPPLPIRKVVTLTVTTLRDAFEMPSPDQLEIELEEFDDEELGVTLRPNNSEAITWWRRGGRRGRGIKVNCIAHFDARGMHRVYGRGDMFPLDGKQTYKRNMDVWLTREGRLLARFWARGYEVDEESFEIIGLSHPPARGKEVGLNEDWVPQSLRDEYDTWVISNSVTPRSAFGL